MLTQAIFKNYVPLKKKGVNSIVLNRTMLFNIILGRNGYGKTSLLRELNPFPPDNADYEEGGYKEVHYKINNDFFKLISETGKKSAHWFYLNGVNLNEGNTLLVQRDLVKQYFGITTEVRNVLTGIDRGDSFSLLSAQKRKSVLMEINPNNTSYGVKIYEKARIAHNQTKGALKHQRQRLAVEEKRQVELKAMSKDEFQEEISRLDSLIQNALILHGSLQGITDPEIKPVIAKLGDIASRLLGNSDKTLHTRSHYIQLIERTQSFIIRDKTRIDGIQALLTDITNKINNFDIPEGMDLKRYEEKIEEVGEELTRIAKEREENLLIIERVDFFSNNTWEVPEYKTDFGDFLTALQSVEITEDKDLTSQGYVLHVSKLEEIRTVLKGLEEDIRSQTHKLKHYESADSVACPECDHKFKIGFEKIDPEKIRASIAALTENFEKNKAEELRLANFIENNEGWYVTMNNLMRVVRYTKEPRFFLDMIREYNIGKVSQSVIQNVLKNVKAVLVLNEQQDTAIARQTTLKAQYALLSESDIRSLQAQFDELSIELGYTQKRMRIRTKDIESFTRSIETIDGDNLLADAYLAELDNLMDLLQQKGKFKIKQKVIEMLGVFTPQKERLVMDLIRAESLSSVIHSIEEQVAELEKREKHLKIIMDNLSPVKGVIGEMMIDFLNSVCANVNAAIEPIWTDSLKLQSCHIEEDGDDIDLDYKFPVLTGLGDKPNEDIRKCSGGEREIIDFMMRRVLHRYVGDRSGIPLIMDEIGITFDELHRGRFIGYINEQLRLDLLPQTFMISHYVNQYGAFNNKDINIIALNTKGLNVPEELNLNTAIQ